MKKKYKPCTIVVFDPKHDPGKHPLKRGESVVFLGYIPNAPGHCIVAKHNGKVVWMVHPDEFRMPTDEEL